MERIAAQPELFDGPVEWHHICYDAVEAELRLDLAAFDPATWQASRLRAAEVVLEKIGEPTPRSGRKVLILDDNMYYRSMRKQWYHVARERNCSFRQVFLAAPTDACLERNRARDAAARVPDFSVEHMAEVFQWPRTEGGSWEALPLVSTTLDSGGASTSEQVDAFVRRWADAGRCSLWTPLPAEATEPAAEQQGEAHECDVALRRVVSRALGGAPRELGAAKSALAKRWGVRKAALAKQLVAEVKGGRAASTEDLIHEMEDVFLRSCVADVQQALAEAGT